MEKGDEEKSTANNLDATERHPETTTTTTTTIAATTQTPESPSTVTQTACDSIEAAAAADAAIVVATDAVDNEIQASPTSKSMHEVSDVEDNANKMNIKPNNGSNNMIRNSDSVMKNKNNKNNNNKKISQTSIPLTIIVEELPHRKAASDDKKLPSQHTLNEILRAHSERTNPATAHMQLEPRSTAATAASSSSSSTATAIATANNGDKDGSNNNNEGNTGHKNKNTPRLSGIMDEMADDMSGGGGTAAGGGGLGDAVTLGSEPDNEPTPTASIRSIGSFVCRICHNAENPERLVSPCYCKGSLTYVHIHCLERWISTSRNTSCELCQFQYNTEQTLRYSCLQSLRMWYSRAISRRALQEDCQMFSLLTLVAFGIVGTLLVGIQYYFLQGRTWGLGRLWTKGWLVFSLFTTLIVYFLNIYMIVRSQLAPWYRWWQSARDIKLILENRKPLEFRPSRRLQNRLAVEVPPTMSAMPQAQQQPAAYHPAAPPPAAPPAAASPAAASNVETSQPATQLAGSQTLRMQFRQQIERAMVVASSELGMYNNGYNYNNIKYSNNIGPIKNNSNILQRNRNRNSYNNSSNNIRIHGNKSDYEYMYSDIYNNNNNCNKYNGPFLPLTHVAATAAAAGGADVTLMPPTAETAAGSVVGLAAVEIFLEPNRFSSYSRRF